MRCQRLFGRIRLVSIAIAVCALLGCGDAEYESPFSVAEGDEAVFSGRVVDEKGVPVEELQLAIQPDGIDGTESHTSNDALEAKTGKRGHFSITDIRPGTWRLFLRPLLGGIIPESDYGILSIKIGEISIQPGRYLHTLSAFDPTSFSITPGVHVQDVKVTVQQRMRVRAKVVFRDGTPLTNEEVKIEIRTRHLDGYGRGGVGGSLRTDARGHFEKYVNRIGFYTVSVEYDDLSVRSEEFLLRAGERREDLVLTFDSAPAP